MEATLSPVIDYGGPIWERAGLLGDLGGARTSLAESGIQAELSLTNIYQGVFDGGREEDAWEFGASADYVFKLDLEKMGLWRGGFLQVNAETYFGEGVNRRTGTLMPVNNDALYPVPGEEITTVPSVVFTQFLSERLRPQVARLVALWSNGSVTDPQRIRGRRGMLAGGEPAATLSG